MHVSSCPRNARQADPLGVDLRQAAEQRMGQDHIGGAGPLVLLGPVDLIEAAPSRRAACIVPLPLAIEPIGTHPQIRAMAA